MKEVGKQFNDGTADILAVALEVHKTLGPGFQEVIYQRALEHEMGIRYMDFSREVNIIIHYKGKKIGMRRVDFIVNDCLVEIKAKSCLEEIDFVQTLSYLRASERKVALLLNFGSKKLEIKRIVN
ncbi:MAG: GxxExxY protein [Candidatus Omnitrophota bacterium]|nr:MAG: GxxExxY protein [Candidatus Omnitrophota bacterium]